jgi:aminotransferase
MINIYQPSLGDEELKIIEDVFKSNWLGYGRQGRYQDEFIKNLSNMLIDTDVNTSVSSDNLLTISCCSEALFQSVESYVNEGDEVIIPSINFVAASNAVVHKKAKPVFCDVNPRTLNVELKHIEPHVTDKTSAIIVIHYAGVPCDIENISEFCKEKNIKLIEDNANSPFSKVNGKSTGTFGNMGLWSFDPMKVITTGDGGVIYCKNKDLLKDIKYRTYLGLKSSGSSNPVDKKWWEFDVTFPGSKYTMNDISAAIGVAQLKKVNDFLKIRKHIHETYNSELSKISWLQTPNDIPNNVISSYYMYHIQLESENDRNELAKYLRKNDIYTTFRYYPLHWVKHYKSKQLLPNVEYAANHTLNIPIHQSLSDDDVSLVIENIKSYK